MTYFARLNRIDRPSAKCIAFGLPPGFDALQVSSTVLPGRGVMAGLPTPEEISRDEVQARTARTRTIANRMGIGILLLMFRLRRHHTTQASKPMFCFGAI